MRKRISVQKNYLLGKLLFLFYMKVSDMRRVILRNKVPDNSSFRRRYRHVIRVHTDMNIFSFFSQMFFLFYNLTCFCSSTSFDHLFIDRIHLFALQCLLEVTSPKKIVRSLVHCKIPNSFQSTLQSKLHYK